MQIKARANQKKIIIINNIDFQTIFNIISVPTHNLLFNEIPAFTRVRVELHFLNSFNTFGIDAISI